MWRLFLLLAGLVQHARARQCGATPPDDYEKQFYEDHGACAADFSFSFPTAGGSLPVCTTTGSVCPTSTDDCMTLVGDAKKSGDWIDLTQGDPGGKDEVGATWSTGTYNATDGFFAEFTFKIDQWTCDDVTCGGDGFAFVLSRAGKGSTGAARSGLGYSGLPYTLAVEFDTYSDSYEQDLVPPYVNVHMSPSSLEEFNGSMSNAQAAPAAVFRNNHLSNYAEYLPNPACYNDNGDQYTEYCLKAGGSTALKPTDPYKVGATFPFEQITETTGPVYELSMKRSGLEPAPTGEYKIITPDEKGKDAQRDSPLNLKMQTQPGLRFADCRSSSQVRNFATSGVPKSGGGNLEQCCLRSSGAADRDHCRNFADAILEKCNDQCLNGTLGFPSEPLAFLPLVKDTDKEYYFLGRSAACSERTQAPFFIDQREHKVQIAYKDNTLKVYMNDQTSDGAAFTESQTPLVTVRCLDLDPILKGSGDVRVGFTGSTSTSVVQKNMIKDFTFKTTNQHQWDAGMSAAGRLDGSTGTVDTVGPKVTALDAKYTRSAVPGAVAGLVPSEGTGGVSVDATMLAGAKCGPDEPAPIEAFSGGRVALALEAWGGTGTDTSGHTKCAYLPFLGSAESGQAYYDFPYTGSGTVACNDREKQNYNCWNTTDFQTKSYTSTSNGFSVIDTNKAYKDRHYAQPFNLVTQNGKLQTLLLADETMAQFTAGPIWEVWIRVQTPLHADVTGLTIKMAHFDYITNEKTPSPTSSTPGKDAQDRADCRTATRCSDLPDDCSKPWGMDHMMDLSAYPSLFSGGLTKANADAATDGWNKFTFDSPFQWDGCRHIVLEVSRNGASTSGSGDENDGLLYFTVIPVNFGSETGSYFAGTARTVGTNDCVGTSCRDADVSDPADPPGTNATLFYDQGGALGTTSQTYVPQIRLSRFPVAEAARKQKRGAHIFDDGLCDLRSTRSTACSNTCPSPRLTATGQGGADMFATLTPVLLEEMGAKLFPAPLYGKSIVAGDEGRFGSVPRVLTETINVTEQFGVFVVDFVAPNAGEYWLELVMELPMQDTYYTADARVVPRRIRLEVEGSPFKLKVQPAVAQSSTAVTVPVKECPLTLPHWCMILGTCVINAEACTEEHAGGKGADNGCKTNTPDRPFRCADGSCVADTQQCPTSPKMCPSGTVMCWDSSCVVDKAHCPTVSPCGDGLLRCPSGACVDNRALCPTQTACPAGQTLCADGSCTSDDNVNRCDVASSTHRCPARFPTRCADGSCAYGPQGCPLGVVCPAHFPVLCADGSCQQNAGQCPTDIVTHCNNSVIGKFRCPDGRCVPASSMCPTTYLCKAGFERCWNGACAPRGQCHDNNPMHNSDKCNAWDLKGQQSLPIRCPGGYCSSAFFNDWVPGTDLFNCPASVVCPRASPFKCPDGTCRDAADRCPLFVPCGFGRRLCPDGTCTDTQCSTPVSCPALTTLCPDGTCRYHADDCPVPEPCPPETPYRCTFSRCAESRASCLPKEVVDCSINGKGSGSAGPVRCSDSDDASACKMSVEQCRALPTSQNPNSDVHTALAVNIPDYESCGGANSILCSNGACVSRKSECEFPPCPPSRSHRCPNGACVASNYSCPEPTTGCLEGQVRCNDGDGLCHMASECENIKSSQKTCRYLSPTPSFLDMTYEATSDQICCGAPYCGDDVGTPCDASKSAAYARKTIAADQACADGSCPNPSPPTLPDGSVQDGCVHVINGGQSGTVSANGCVGDYVKCADGTCVSKEEDCRYSVGCTHRCPNGLCVLSMLWCPAVLTTAPGKCEDVHKTNGTYPCADGTCAPSATDCPNIPYCGLTVTDGTQPGAYRCGDGTCRREAWQCPGGSTCPASRPVRCPLGECVETSAECIGAVPTESFGPIKLYPCPENHNLCFPTGACYPSLPSGTTSDPDGLLSSTCDTTACNGFWLGSQDYPRAKEAGNPMNTSKFNCANYGFAISAASGNPYFQALLDNGGQAAVDNYPFDNAGTGCPLASPQKCFNGMCVADGAACPLTDACPDAEKGVVCADGTCVSDVSACPAKVVCPSDAPNLCADGTCTAYGYFEVGAMDIYRMQCHVLPKCPAGTFRCNDRTCAAKAEDCESRKANCPTTAPTKCPHMGECVVSPLDCAGQPGATCQADQFRCASASGTPPTVCQASPNACPQQKCGDDKPAQCWDGSCKADANDCPILPACPPERSVRAPDGSCKEAAPTMTFTTPECSDGKSLCADGVCRQDCSQARYDGCGGGGDAPMLCSNGKCLPYNGKCNKTSSKPVYSQKFAPVNIYVSNFEGLNVTLAAEQNRTTSRLSVPPGFSRKPLNADATRLVVRPVADSDMEMMTAAVPRCRREVFGREPMPYYKVLTSIVVDISEPSSIGEVNITSINEEDEKERYYESQAANATPYVPRQFQFLKPIVLSMYSDTSGVREFFNQGNETNGDELRCNPLPNRFDPAQDLCLAHMPYPDAADSVSNVTRILSGMCTAWPAVFYQTCPPGYAITMQAEACAWPNPSWDLMLGAQAYCERSDAGTGGAGWPDPPGNVPSKAWTCVSRPTTINTNGDMTFAEFKLQQSGRYAVIVAPKDTAKPIAFAVVPKPAWAEYWYLIFPLLLLCCCCCFVGKKARKERLKVRAEKKRRDFQLRIIEDNKAAIEADARNDEALMFDNPLRNKARLENEKGMREASEYLRALQDEEQAKKDAEERKKEQARQILREQEEIEAQLVRMKSGTGGKKHKKKGAKKKAGHDEDHDFDFELADIGTGAGGAINPLSTSSNATNPEAERLAKTLQ